LDVRTLSVVKILATERSLDTLGAHIDEHQRSALGSKVYENAIVGLVNVADGFSGNLPVSHIRLPSTAIAPYAYSWTRRTGHQTLPSLDNLTGQPAYLPKDHHASVVIVPFSDMLIFEQFHSWYISSSAPGDKWSE
jgi:hypothetical protein